MDTAEPARLEAAHARRTLLAGVEWDTLVALVCAMSDADEAAKRLLLAA